MVWSTGAHVTFFHHVAPYVQKRRTCGHLGWSTLVSMCKKNNCDWLMTWIHNENIVQLYVLQLCKCYHVAPHYHQSKGMRLCVFGAYFVIVFWFFPLGFELQQRRLSLSVPWFCHNKYMVQYLSKGPSHSVYSINFEHHDALSKYVLYSCFHGYVHIHTYSIHVCMSIHTYICPFVYVCTYKHT